jgi:DNA-binding MarR family transcriptional regulator
MNPADEAYANIVPLAADAGGDAVRLGIIGEAVGYLLKRAQMAVFADFNRTFAEEDVRPAQFSILIVVDDNPGLKQSQLSHALGIKRTNIVSMLDGLAQRGLLERRQVVGDRRSYALHLTAKGAALCKSLRTKWAAHEDRMLASIGPENREILTEWLGKIVATGGLSDGEDLADDGDSEIKPVQSRRAGRALP